MALANYADLLTAVASWLNRSDLAATIPDMIALTEAEFNRSLRTPDMETRATATLTGEAIAVPTDFIGARSLMVDRHELQYIPPADLFDIADTSGVPVYYTVADEQFFFRPVPSSGDVEIAYFAKIPALTASNTTNWLMTRYPDLYLFAVLAQAEFFGWNDRRVPMIKARVEEIMEQINADTQKRRYGGKPVSMRLPTSPTLGRSIRA